MAFDLINSSTVKQIKAVNGVFLHLAKTHPPPQPLRPGCKGAGRQSGHLGSLLNLSHGCRFSSSAGASSKFSSLLNRINLAHVHMFCLETKQISRTGPSPQATKGTVLPGHYTESDGQRSAMVPLCEKEGLSWVTSG